MYSVQYIEYSVVRTKKVRVQYVPRSDPPPPGPGLAQPGATAAGAVQGTGEVLVGTFLIPSRPPYKVRMTFFPPSSAPPSSRLEWHETTYCSTGAPRRKSPACTHHPPRPNPPAKQHCRSAPRPPSSSSPSLSSPTFTHSTVTSVPPRPCISVATKDTGSSRFPSGRIPPDNLACFSESPAIFVLVLLYSRTSKNG